MLIEVLKSKLHCVTITEANLHYMGSITIDEDLMDAANLIAGEKVQIVNNNNGERIETYIIKGERGSGCICLNGAAARRAVVGDVVIMQLFFIIDKILFNDHQGIIFKYSLPNLYGNSCYFTIFFSFNSILHLHRF